MKITVSPMLALRAAAVDRVNAHFNGISSKEVHRDQAHAAKRRAAVTLLAGGEAYPEFYAEAEMLGMSSIDFAMGIAAKPDNAAARELERQRLMLAIAAAKHPDELPML